MRSENKELEYSLDKLRQQRIEAENKLELMVCVLYREGGGGQGAGSLIRGGGGIYEILP